MLARLWWKEWRIFGPAGLLLLLGAGGVQGLYLMNNGHYARDGSATPLAMIWAVIYAYAAGAAAFAGEREGKTLGFLDALPVSRRVLWLGKASFAFVSTAVLLLLLTLMAEWITTTRNEVTYQLRETLGTSSVFLVEGLAWGLFWSSVLRNPLAAGALALASAATISIFTTRTLGLSVSSDGLFYTARLIAAGLALAGSAVVMTSRGLPYRLELVRRSEQGAGSMAIRPASTGRSLAWQAMREGWTTWVLGTS